MIFLAPLLFSGILGALILFYLTRSVRLPFYPLFIASLAFPAGFSVNSIILYFCYLLKANQGPFLSLFVSTGLVVFLLIQSLRLPSLNAIRFNFPWPESNRQKIIGVVCLLIWLITFWKLCTLFKAASLANIFGGWDAKFFWNVKAKFFFESPAEWKNMFSPLLSWTHPDYPLLLPGAIAWGWNWTGKEILIWPALVSFVFLTSLALFVFWYLSATTHLWSGLLGSAFFMTLGAYSFWGVSQYADVPLSFFITTSGVFLLLGFRYQSRALFLISGWFAGCALWTKNEGLFFAGWLVLASIIVLFLKKAFRSGIKPLLISLAAGLAIPSLAVFILKAFLSKGGDYLGPGRSAAEYLHALFDWTKTKFILQSIPIYMWDFTSWNGLWVLFASAIILFFLRKDRTQNDQGILALLVLFILLGYIGVLHISPHPVVWQIQTALQRLLLHAGGLALLFTFEVYGSFAANPSKTSSRSSSSSS